MQQTDEKKPQHTQTHNGWNGVPPVYNKRSATVCVCVPFSVHLFPRYCRQTQKEMRAFRESAHVCINITVVITFLSQYFLLSFTLTLSQTVSVCTLEKFHSGVPCAWAVDQLNSNALAAVQQQQQQHHT